ncbi:MAG: sulfonate transport system ATP-binding protein [Chloroflexota bacterium]|nr:sulfonate transport system ATP-binding protein [Chloroflexota bacterium]
MLRIENLGKAFGSKGQFVLEGFDLTVARGEFVTLIGPSGCGKTTALRIAAGLLEANTGQVFVDDKPSMGPSRDKAIVFQHFNLFPWRSALENVAYGLEIQGMGRNQRREIAVDHLRLVGLDTHLGHYPWQMSGGQQQRVGIARALAISPKLLLMDEPFGALDALTRERLQGELQRICLERNLTVLFVTHSIDEAIYLSDRIVVMGVRPGRIIAEFRIDLPKPRADYNFRAREEYGAVRGEIWALLEKQLQRAEAIAS